MATVAVGCVVGGIVCTENHGAQGGKTSSNYGNRRLDHRDGARQHCLVLLGVIGSNDWCKVSRVPDSSSILVGTYC